MSAPVAHWFGVYGPLCGKADGVNAADMDPPEITCRRCLKAPVQDGWFRPRYPNHAQPVQEIVRRDGRTFLVPKEAA